MLRTSQEILPLVLYNTKTGTSSGTTKSIDNVVPSLHDDYDQDKLSFGEADGSPLDFLTLQDFEAFDLGR